MKVISKKEFYELPEGKVYSNYRPICIDGLMIKVDTIFHDGEAGDFNFQNLIGNIEAEGSEDYVDKLFDSTEKGTDLKLDFAVYERDGMFEDNAQYVVYSKADLDGLINCLQSCKGYDE